MHECEGAAPLEALGATRECSRNSGRRRVAERPGLPRFHSFLGLNAAERVEDQVPNGRLCADVPVGGAEQRERPAFPVHRVLPGRERYVSPSGATFPNGEADELQPAERACVGLEDHFRVGQLPRWVAGRVRNDPYGHDFTVAF